MEFRAGDTTFDLERRVLLMGILNVTPDSFSGGDANSDVDTAVASGLRMLEDGADVIDVGGESTRPGAKPVDVEKESQRVIPVIRELSRRSNAVISIDTWKSEVAEQAIHAGASIINDVSGFKRDPDLKHVAASTKVGCVAMHMRGTPQTMQNFTDYVDLIREINDAFDDSMTTLMTAGVAETAISLDPGIGFSKTMQQNLLLMKRLDAFMSHGRPILLGPSRKSFIGLTLNLDEPKDRIWGTAATVAYGIAKGARIIRVHDVVEMKQVIDMTVAMEFSEGTNE